MGCVFLCRVLHVCRVLRGLYRFPRDRVPCFRIFSEGTNVTFRVVGDLNAITDRAVRVGSISRYGTVLVNECRVAPLMGRVHVRFRCALRLSHLRVFRPSVFGGSAAAVVNFDGRGARCEVKDHAVIRMRVPCAAERFAASSRWHVSFRSVAVTCRGVLAEDVRAPYVLIAPYLCGRDVVSLVRRAILCRRIATRFRIGSVVVVAVDLCVRVACSAAVARVGVCHPGEALTGLRFVRRRVFAPIRVGRVEAGVIFSFYRLALFCECVNEDRHVWLFRDVRIEFEAFRPSFPDVRSEDRYPFSNGDGVLAVRDVRRQEVIVAFRAFP